MQTASRRSSSGPEGIRSRRSLFQFEVERFESQRLRPADFFRTACEAQLKAPRRRCIRRINSNVVFTAVAFATKSVRTDLCHYRKGFPDDNQRRGFNNSRINLARLACPADRGQISPSPGKPRAQPVPAPGETVNSPKSAIMRKAVSFAMGCTLALPRWLAGSMTFPGNFRVFYWPVRHSLRERRRPSRRKEFSDP